MFEIGKIYLRSIVGLISMSAVGLYAIHCTGDIGFLTEYFLACGVLVYIDKALSGNVEKE